MPKSMVSKVLEEAIAEEYVGHSHELLQLFCVRVLEAVVDSRVPKSLDAHIQPAAHGRTPADQTKVTALKFGVEFATYPHMRKALKMLYKGRFVLESPILLLTFVQMPDADDLYLEAFWIVLEPEDSTRRTISLADLYSRLCLAMRSVIVILRTSTMRRLITRSWTEARHLFRHVLFSSESALKNLKSLPNIASIFPVFTPLGNLRIGCVSRSHEVHAYDPWNILHSVDHELCPAVLLDQFGNILENTTVVNCRTVHPVRKSSLSNPPAEYLEVSSKCPPTETEIIPEIKLVFATKHCQNSTALVELPDVLVAAIHGKPEALLSPLNSANLECSDPLPSSVPVITKDNSKTYDDQVPEMNLAFASCSSSCYSELFNCDIGGNIQPGFQTDSAASVILEVQRDLDRYEALLHDFTVFCSSLDEDE